MKDNTIHLLLVEDDKVDQMAFERYVKQENLPYDYSIAKSVHEGKKILQETDFDIIISDYWLGDGTSFELFEQFKDIPVIVTTGTGNEEVAVEAMKLGASDYLIKDPDGRYLKTLPATVNLALQRKKNERELQNYHHNLELMVEARTAELQTEVVERELAEGALRRSEKRFRDISHSMADWIWEVDTQGRYTYLSNSGKKVLGYTADELIGKTPFELMSDKEGARVREIFFESARECKALVDLENWNITKDGSTVCLLTNGVPILGTNGELLGYRGVDKNITKQRELEKDLLQSQKMEAIGTLAGGIAHDFNNILAAILGYSEFIKNAAPPESPIEKDIQEVIKAGRRATDLVKQILTISRQSAVENQPLRPHLIIKEAMKMMRATLPTSITIEDSIDPDCGIIWADATNIHQITMNLCTNALHAMSDGKGTLSVSLIRSVVSDTKLLADSSVTPGPFVVLTVSDTGCGMDRTVSDRIFEPYFTTKKVGKGTGLGLAVIQGIVQEAHGFIRVESTPGVGSSFAVYFPVLQEKSFAIKEAQQKMIPQGGDEHILVVDDEALLVRVIQRQLEKVGYTVTATSSSNDALEKIEANPDSFDLLITDQTMPGLTGEELAVAAIQSNADLPVILCTGHSDQVSKERALELGVKEYILKPIVGNELFDVVRSVLDEG